MKNKLIGLPQRFNGKKAELESRLICLAGGSALALTFPIAALARGIEKVSCKDYTDTTLGEYVAAIKTCFYTAFTGRFPKAA